VLGDWTSSRRLRCVVGGLNSSARRDLARRGLDTGRPGLWLGRRRVIVRAALVVLAVVWLLVLRPLSFGDVVRIAGVTLLVAWALELLQQRPDELADQAPAKPAAP
jgi:Flp pilus assembly protein TadB